MRRMCRCMEWPPLLVTSPHGVTSEKHWRLAQFVFALVFEVAVNFFYETYNKSFFLKVEMILRFHKLEIIQIQSRYFLCISTGPEEYQLCQSKYWPIKVSIALAVVPALLSYCRCYNRYVQCRWLNVWSVYFYFNTLSCKKYFSRGYGGCTKYMQQWKFWRGGQLVLVVKKWKVGEEGRLTLNSFHGGGIDLFWNYTFLILSDKSCFH